MRTRIALVPAVLCGLVLAPLGTAQARTSVAEPAITVAGGVTVTGNGYGHGHGMSQYGAQGAAKLGLTSDQILDFYYPGTAKGSFTGRVRVLIGKDSDGNTVVRPAAGLTLTDLGDAKTYKLPVGTAKRWRLSLAAGKTRVTYLSGGIWRVYRPGGKATLVGGGEFRAGSNLLSLLIAGVDHRYRGALRFTTGRTVNVLGIDGYLRGVIPAEMPTSWMTHALRSQAVAARTYAAHERAGNVNDTYQLYDDTRSQVYGGYDVEVASTNAAVVATAGQIRTSGGAPAFTKFSASNGGWSVNGGRSYLVAKPDPYDKAYRHWTQQLDVAKIRSRFPGRGALTKVQVLSRDGHGEWGGRVLSLRLTFGSGATVTLNGDSDIRYGLGSLKSSWISLS